MTFQSKRKVALFTAMCMFCSMLEIIIPKPVFLRIGLSNLPIMLALYSSFSVPEYCILVICRIFFQLVINGTLFSFSFFQSLASGIISATAMYLVYRIKNISFITVSIIGAFFSNITQLAVAYVILGNGVLNLAPTIFIFGLVTSTLLGVTAQFFCTKSEFLKCMNDESFFSSHCKQHARVHLEEVPFSRKLKIVFSTIMLIICYFTKNIWYRSVISLYFLALCLISKRKIRFGAVLWFFARSIFINLLMPYGDVLFKFGALSITQHAFVRGVTRSAMVLSTCWYSRLIVPIKSRFYIVYKPDSIVFQSFSYFKDMTEKWFSVEKNGLINRIDKTLEKTITD